VKGWPVKSDRWNWDDDACDELVEKLRRMDERARYDRRAWWEMVIVVPAIVERIRVK
jgi:hypothetical protein